MSNDLDTEIFFGDNVRIRKKKKTFYKGYSQRWTEDSFTISKIPLTILVIYKKTNCNGEEIQGSFCERELQKTSQDVFRIEKVLKRRGDKSLVKWADIMIRLISGLIIKTLVNDRAKA